MRFHKRFIWQRFFVFLAGVIPVLYLFSAVAFVETDEGMTFSGMLGIDSSLGFLIGLLIILVVYGILDYIYSYLYWKKTTYDIKDNEISLQKGVFFKRNIVIEFENIHAVTIERSLICMIVGLSKLCIDSGNATTSRMNEIEIFDLPMVISQMEQDVKERMNLYKKQKIRKNLDSVKENTLKLESEEKVLSYDITKKMKRRMVLLSFPFIFGIIMAIVVLVGTNIMAYAMNLDSGEEYDFIIFVGTFVLILIFLLGGYIGGRIGLWLKYYNFKIIYNDNEIIVQYGLLHQWKFYIDRDKIKAFVYKQDIIQKKAKFGSLEVHMVGLYENQENNQGSFAKLFPYMDIELLNKSLEELNIFESFKISESTCRKNSFIYFILLPIIIASIIILPLIICLLFGEIIASLVISIVYVAYILLIVVLGYIRKNNQSISYDNDNIYLSSGTIYRTSSIIPWNSVVSIGTKTTFLREKNGIVSVVVSYYTDKGKAIFTVEMQDIKTYGEILLFFESIKNR